MVKVGLGMVFIGDLKTVRIISIVRKLDYGNIPYLSYNDVYLFLGQTELEFSDFVDIYCKRFIVDLLNDQDLIDFIGGGKDILFEKLCKRIGYSEEEALLYAKMR